MPTPFFCVLMTTPVNFFISIYLYLFKCQRRFFAFQLGTTQRRRDEEIQRLNSIYSDVVILKSSIHKCLKYLCQTEPYRMLKDWTYEIHADPIEGESNIPDIAEVGLQLFL